MKRYIKSDMTPYKPKFWERWVEEFLDAHDFGNDKFPHTLDSWYDLTEYVATVTFENGITRDEYELLNSALKAEIPKAYTYPIKRGTDLYTDVDFEFPIYLYNQYFDNNGKSIFPRQ